MKKRLITSALPYVNNIPHLGNLIQVLSADVFARFCRSRGYETLYVCGSDEYGTATETKAREEGLSPRELCDKNHEIHKNIYEWFNIAFDHYGRTSTEFQTQIVQEMFEKVREAGYISQRSTRQLYSRVSNTFLADRYVCGTCPHCNYEDARGDQCENCGTLLDPEQLINPRSILDNSTPVLKETTHFYIKLPELLPKLEAWMHEASEAGRWAHNAKTMTRGWIRDGLRERAITRDLEWGIPVPVEGFEDKVFYVWFDAPIGYISITAEFLSKKKNIAFAATSTWKKELETWWQNPGEVELFQFIGKDNIPFHTVVFPSCLLATGDAWTMLKHMSSSEYMNYEGGKFSKSKGLGVFGTDARETGIPADMWRFYLFYNRPETGDYTFAWKDFQETINKELIGNIANLVNRSLGFYTKNFGREVPALTEQSERSSALWTEVKRREEDITDLLEWAQLRDALREILRLSNFANKTFQEAEPWKLKDSEPEAARELLQDIIFLVRDLSILLQPFIPETARALAGFLQGTEGEEAEKAQSLWEDLADTSQNLCVNNLRHLFKPIEDEAVEAFRRRYAGGREEAKDSTESAESSPKKEASAHTAERPSPKKAKKPSASERLRAEDANLSDEDRFAKRVELRVARILRVEKHPNADSLYIEHIDDATGEARQIVSGLVRHYTSEELQGRNIILVANLKPAKLRGVVSQGMLLAASGEGEAAQSAEEEEGTAPSPLVDVIFADHAQPGDKVFRHNDDETDAAPLKQIDVDSFFDIPLRTQNGYVCVGDSVLCVAGRPLRSERVLNGTVG